MQLRHMAELDRLAKLVTQGLHESLQALHRLGRAFGLQRHHEHLGVGQVTGDLDIGHADRGQAMLAHGVVHEGAQLAAELGGNAVGAMEGLGHVDYSVRWTSTRSKHSIWSPGLTSLYCFTPMPHSVLTRTSSTFSLKRRSDSSSPSKMTRSEEHTSELQSRENLV